MEAKSIHFSLRTFSRVVLLALVLAGLTACATSNGEGKGDANDGSVAAPPSQASSPESSKPKEDPAAKRAALDRKLAIAKAKVEQVGLEMSMQEKSAKDGIEFAERELDLARTKLAHFRTFESPNKLARGKLSLQTAMDYAQEADEELKQLEIMYEEQDLEDRTSEFVLNRGKRNAERRKAQLALEEASLRALEEQEIPRELATLEVDVARKEAALEKAKLEAELGALQKKIARMGAEAEIADLEEQIRRLDAEEAAK